MTKPPSRTEFGTWWTALPLGLAVVMYTAPSGEALEATILAPAWLAREERTRGKLLPGYLADLVVLDRDPLAIEPEELPEIGVVATMVGGRWTHNPPPWD